MAKQARALVLGTAGHIDHGKTSLVRALTGVDTDRLPEEKRRGITIELGFAAWTVAPGVLASIVDVPGHEAFVRTMVAGAGGIDAVLLVVDAEDGVMPQTREHLHVCNLLGLRHGVVALTKTDRLGGDPDALALAEADVRAALADLAPNLANVPVIPVSAHTGDGLPALTAAIRKLATTLEPRDIRDRPILPIDRVFAVKGHGTVATGTLLAGRIDILKDTRFTDVPVGQGRNPAELRARALHVRGDALEQTTAGNRVALNLGNVATSDLSRGDVITTGHRVRRSDTILAVLTHLAHDDRPWRTGTTVEVCAGTTHTTARLTPVGPLDDPPVDNLSQEPATTRRYTAEPGATAVVRLRLDAPLPVWHGQRLIIRTTRSGELSRRHGHTTGGGVVVDPRPSSGRAQRDRWLKLARVLHRGSPTDRVLALLRDAAALGIPRDELEHRAGVTDLEPVLTDISSRDLAIPQGEQRWLDAGVLPPLAAAAAQLVQRFHAEHPLQPGLSRAAALGGLPGRVAPDVAATAISHALTHGLLQTDGDLLILPKAENAPPARLPPQLQSVLDLYIAAGITPPTLREVQEKTRLSERQTLEALGALQRSGAIVRVSPDLSLARTHHESLLDKARTHLRAHGQLDVQILKDLTGLSRKFVVPFLEHLDRLQMTRRQGNTRLPGPRL